MLNGIKRNQMLYYNELFLKSSKDANLFLRESYTGTDFNSLKEYYSLESAKIVINLRRLTNMSVELLDEKGNIISVKEGMIGILNEKIQKIVLNGNPVYQKIGSEITYFAPIYDYEEQIGVYKIRYNSAREDKLYNDMKFLYYKIGIFFIILTSLLGSLYFGKIANIILKLKDSVKFIGEGKYNNVDYIKTNDELEELGIGISELSNIINKNFMDLNNQKDKLEKMIKKLQILEMKQSTFIGNITHEFKTPLTVLKIQFDLMDLYKLDDTMANDSKKIVNTELKKLNSMVENILYLSKIEKYDYEFNKDKVNLQKLLIDIIDRLKYTAIQSDIQMVVNVEQMFIFGDKDSLVQIFTNLLDNAIKYSTSNGKVVIKNFMKNELNYIQIENNAINISKEDQIKIFEPFYTIDQSRNKNISGTGLGLPLVKNLIESNNGRIQVDSNNNKIIFTVIFDNYNK